MGDPPEEAGAVQEIVATAVPLGVLAWLVAVTPVGALGTVVGDTLPDVPARLLPAALVATTVKVYEVPTARPLMLQDVPLDGEQVRLPGVDVTV